MSYPVKIGIIGGGTRTLSQMTWQNKPTNLFNVYIPGSGVQSGGRALAHRAQLKPGTMENPQTGKYSGSCNYLVFFNYLL